MSGRKASATCALCHRNTYLERASEEICLIVQVETGTELTLVEVIGTVDGVDAAFIGPSDLTESMEHVGRPTDPDVHTAIKDGPYRPKAADVRSVRLATTQDDTVRIIKMEFDFVAVSVDPLRPPDERRTTRPTEPLQIRLPSDPEIDMTHLTIFCLLGCSDWRRT